QNSKSKRNMDYKKIAENVDITPFESIEILGGEPLFIPSAKKFFDYITSKGKKVSLLTNGTLINKKWAEKIALHSDFINISLNAATKQTHEFINRGSRWESVLNNIQKLHNAREVLKTNLHIYGHMTIVRQNLMEISMFIERFRDFGFDTIEFGFDFRVPFYLKLHPKKKRIIRLNVKEALEKCKDNSLVDTLRLQKLGIA
ncbi:MAG: radical SAM protein, partial [Candidatus Cloacimonetes bacterium]|nr:radical SAM protein [Candidatus Cloacimonadota bacterium]